jgi:hypothetical protein
MTTVGYWGFQQRASMARINTPLQIQQRLSTKMKREEGTETRNKKDRSKTYSFNWEIRVKENDGVLKT